MNYIHIPFLYILYTTIALCKIFIIIISLLFTRDIQPYDYLITIKFFNFTLKD